MSAAPPERELDELREDPNASAAVDASLVTEGVEPVTPTKRGRGRPKGSKNKKTIEAEQSGVPVGSSTQGEKRKRGRPPKVPYHLQFTDPTIIHDAIQNQAANNDSTSDKPPPKKRGRPPKKKPEEPGAVAAAAAADDAGDEEEGGDPKRVKSNDVE